ncbi:hypothetical protein L211DRAFT_262836 [Terfezia boudieri ATCC MYA-4762]|uniref:Uncharacterized protein n=1 Tax=Terfezia boudieri ATCC MYA-4762 TaxID=1051890 RepID=A0A3N4M222_9PEZI|nr:hypothetical protein L211DRAFT_262836 [Terfezia boudieri ATCC MYA-4762]
MPSRGYETHNDDANLASTLSTSNGGQALDLIAERRRAHEIYAAQYRHDAGIGSLPSGYLPLTMEPQRSPAINPAGLFWGHQLEQAENNRAPSAAAAVPVSSQRNGSLKFTPQPGSRPCALSSSEATSQGQSVASLTFPQLGADINPPGTTVRGPTQVDSGFQPQSTHEQVQECFSNLESPWTMRQPGIPAAGPSASGNVATRLASTRASGNQQAGAGTASNVVSTGSNGLMVADTESFFTHGLPVSFSSNVSTDSVSSSQESSLQSNMFDSSFSDYYQLSNQTHQLKNSVSCVAQGYSVDTDVGRLSLQFPQFTPAPTPHIRSAFGEGIFSRNNTDSAREASEDSTNNRKRSENSHKLTRTPSTFLTSNASSGSVIQTGVATERAPGRNSSAKPEPSIHLGSSKLFDQPTLMNSGDGLRSSIQHPTPSTSSLYHDNGMLSFSPTSNLEDPFLDNYFNPRRKNRDASVVPDVIADSWPAFGVVECRKSNGSKTPSKPTLAERIERNERWNDLIETAGHTHTQNRSTVPSCVPAIDHYHGSFQQPSRGRHLNLSRSQMFHASHGGHSSAAYNHHLPRSQYSSNNQRCGSCYIVKSELDHTKHQLLECMKERDHLHKLVLQFQRRLHENEIQNHRLNERLQYQNSPPTSKRSSDSPEIHDTSTRLQQFYQRHLQFTGFQYQHSYSDANNIKDDQYFQSEFAMLFTSSVKSWADRYFKFPTAEGIPQELEDALKNVFERDDYVESLIGSEKTKSFVVQGLVSRFIRWEIFDPAFQRILQSTNESALEGESGKRCSKICKSVHDLIRILISRCNDPTVVDASERSLQNIFEHADRLSSAMSRAGGDKEWFIDFPQVHEQFKADLMHDAEQYYKNIDALSLERERAVIKMVAMPLVVRVQQRKQPSVIFKAQVLLRPFSY